MDRYLLASYDYTKAKGYILSAGDYYFTIGDNAHDALNNVLAAENATGMTDFDGKPVEGDAAKTYRWSYDDVDTKTYAKSDAGERVTNRFEDADANYWKDGAVTYLTRSDWKGTFPTEPVKMTATGKMIELLKGDLYRQSKDSKSVSDYTQGADNGLTFVMMKDVDYNDDETWNKYLDEMTIDEMTTQLSDLFGTAEAASVNRPAYAAGDGTASVGGNTYAKEYGDARDVTLYPATNVLAIYVLDQVIRSLLGRYLDLNAFSGQWYLFFVVCGYVLLVMLLAAVCNELRKLTIGRIETWLTGIVAAFLQSCGALLVRIGQRIVHWFISMD